MTPDADSTERSLHNAGQELVGTARNAARNEAVRWLVYAAIVGLLILSLAVFLGGWWVVNATRDNAHHVAEQAAKAEARKQADDQQNQATAQQLAELKKQIISINADRANHGLPPIKKVEPSAGTSTGQGENTRLIAQLAAALVPAPKDGKNGAAGKDGKPGKNGANGTNGVSITAVSITGCKLIIATSDQQSYSGNVCGPAGKTGQAGANGANGKDGADGASAYQIWLAAGNTGSESDFLNSLRGADGVDGTNGVNGVNGVNGADGRDGADGANGKDGSPAQTETFTFPDGTVYSCPRDSGSPDTAPTYTCAVSTPGPPNPPPSTTP